MHTGACVLACVHACDHCTVGLMCATGFDVNFMDGVGQTLLNWAAAFGTQEMVCT